MGPFKLNRTPFKPVQMRFTPFNLNVQRSRSTWNRASSVLDLVEAGR